MIGQSLWISPTRSPPGMSAAVKTADHTVGGERRGRVDRGDVGAGVFGEPERGVQHARHTDVVDVVAIPERQLPRLVLGAGATNGRRQLGLELLADRHRLDRIEDLDVAGAPAEVGAEVRLHRVAREARALLVDLGLGPHHDAGDAEPALQSAARGEGVGVRVTLGLIDALERHDRAAVDLLERLLAGHDSLAVDQHRAAAALPRGRATVLGRGHVELLAQGGEQMRVLAVHRHGCPVEDEGGGRRRTVDSRAISNVGHSSTVRECERGSASE